MSALALSLDQKRALVASAARAPSAYNTQPARWRIGSSHIELYEDRSRQLASADPAGRHQQIALGAAWEGMCIALAEHGLMLSEPESFSSDTSLPANWLPVVRGEIQLNSKRDPLFAVVTRRNSYRAEFPRASAKQHADLRAWMAMRAEHRLILLREEIDRIAKLNDAAVVNRLNRVENATEHCQWLRNGAPGNDGVSAACLARSALQMRLTRPGTLSTLSTFGLLKSVVGERSRVRSACALIMISKKIGAKNFAAGREWYRFWLALTARGFCGVPMSALVDDPVQRNTLLKEFPLLADRELVTVMRVGPKPAFMPSSVRLPVQDLMLL